MAEREGFEPSVEFPLHTLSKRARSTTPTSLRFRINELRTAWNSVAQNPPSIPTVPRCDLNSAVYRRGPREHRGNCVRPLHVRRSLTGDPRDHLRAIPAVARSLRLRPFVSLSSHRETGATSSTITPSRNYWRCQVCLLRTRSSGSRHGGSWDGIRSFQGRSAKARRVTL
jgi:hypothetical protein